LKQRKKTVFLGVVEQKVQDRE